jgi:hypothetical protein
MTKPRILLVDDAGPPRFFSLLGGPGEPCAERSEGERGRRAERQHGGRADPEAARRRPEGGESSKRGGFCA